MDLEKVYYRVFNKKLPIPDEVVQFGLLLTDGSSVFASTIEKDSIENVLIERVFGVRNKKGKVEIEEVLRLRDDFKGSYCRNLHLTFCGYKPIWKDSKISYYSCDEYESKQVFEKCRIDYPNFYKKNLFTLDDVIKLKPEYKYCCWDGQGSVAEYLNKYKEEPYLEMLQKLNLGWFVNKKKIVNKLQDKAFRKFLFKQSKIIIAYNLDVNQILKMFNKNMTAKQVIEEKEVNLLVKHNQDFFKRYPMLDAAKVFNYIDEQKTSFSSYKDLIDAVAFLKLNLNDSKNVYPHEFQKYHDLYTAQMSSVKNKKIDKKIVKISQKYSKFLKTYDDITMMFPKDTADFINEGSALHHCVGRMGYNKKMAEGKSLIIFIRHKEEINKPFLTLELEPNKKKILQFYGDHDSTPPENINNLIRNVWLNDIQKIRAV